MKHCCCVVDILRSRLQLSFLERCTSMASCRGNDTPVYYLANERRGLPLNPPLGCRVYALQRGKDLCRRLAVLQIHLLSGLFMCLLARLALPKTGNLETCLAAVQPFGSSYCSSLHYHTSHTAVERAPGRAVSHSFQLLELYFTCCALMCWQLSTGSASFQGCRMSREHNVFCRSC